MIARVTFGLLSFSLFEEMLGPAGRLDNELGFDASELIEMDLMFLG